MCVTVSCSSRDTVNETPVEEVEVSRFISLHSNVVFKNYVRLFLG